MRSDNVDGSYVTWGSGDIMRFYNADGDEVMRGTDYGLFAKADDGEWVHAIDRREYVMSDIKSCLDAGKPLPSRLVNEYNDMTTPYLGVLFNLTEVM